MGFIHIKSFLILVITIGLIAILRESAVNWLHTVTDYITDWVCFSYMG